MATFILSENESAIMRLKPNVSATWGIGLLYGTCAFSISRLVVAMLDPSLPALITATVPMVTAVGSLIFVLRRQNADRAAALKRELAVNAKTAASLQIAEARNFDLTARFEEFKTSSQDEAYKLREAMVARDRHIEAQEHQIDELTKRLQTQSILINSVESILKTEGIDHPRIRAAFVEYNGSVYTAVREIAPQ